MTDIIEIAKLRDLQQLPYQALCIIPRLPTAVRYYYPTFGVATHCVDFRSRATPKSIMLTSHGHVIYTARSYQSDSNQGVGHSLNQNC